MLLLEFYRRTLPPGGIYDLFTTEDRCNHWHDDLESLAAATEALGERSDIYFAVAAFKAAGSTYKGRTQDQVASLKCMRLDLDAGATKLAKHGPEKVYETQRDALRSLGEFTKATGLMFSLLVSSGEGLHVYYELEEAAEPADWQPVAKAFQKFGSAQGMKIDSSVTADHARVLRPIGTLHPNGQQVTLLRDTGAVYTLEDFAERVGLVAAPVSPKYDLSVNDDLLPIQGPPKTIKKVLQRCAAMKRAYQQQDSIEEPYWRLAIGVAKHTVEGFEAARALSKRHPDYDESSLREKFDRWASGPARCDSFAECAPTACQGCQYRGRITSPIQLGDLTSPEIEALPPEARAPEPEAPAPTGKPWDGCIPKGFNVITESGAPLLVAKLIEERENEVGERVPVEITVPITRDVFWLGSWADADHGEDTAQAMVVKPDGRNYTFDQTLIANQQKLREYLASKSIITTSHPKANRAMEEYTKAQINRIRHLSQRPKVTQRFGLRITPTGQLHCAQGGYVITPDGTIFDGMLGTELRGLASQFVLPLPPTAEGQWGPAVWDSEIIPRAKRHLDFLRTQYGRPGLEKFQLAAMLALASPLMAFVTGEYVTGIDLPPNGLSVSLYSQEGGRGKSTLMKAVALAFGKTGATCRDMNSLGSTDKARVARMTMMGTMPVGLDEMGGVNAKSMSDLIYAIANGSSREGALVNGGLRMGSTWAFTALLASNKSQREILAVGTPESAAVQFRLLELDVDKIREFNTAERAQFQDEWAALAGSAGCLGAYIHYLICRTGVAAINQLVMSCVNKASEITGADQTSRFQYRALGAALALHLLLRKEGLELFSVPAMVKEFKHAHDTAREFVAENTTPTAGAELLANMLHDLHHETVSTQHHTRRSRFVTQFDRPIGGRTPPVVSIRHIVDTRRTYIAAQAIRKWCEAHGAPQSKMLRECKDAGILVETQPGLAPGIQGAFNLLGGMEESTGTQVRCYAVDATRLVAFLGRTMAALPFDVAPDNVVQLSPKPAESTQPPAEEAESENAA